jgi:hypothetical protein
MRLSIQYSYIISYLFEEKHKVFKRMIKSII